MKESSRQGTSQCLKSSQMSDGFEGNAIFHGVRAKSKGIETPSRREKYLSASGHEMERVLGIFMACQNYQRGPLGFQNYSKLRSNNLFASGLFKFPIRFSGFSSSPFLLSERCVAITDSPLSYAASHYDVVLSAHTHGKR